MLNLPVVNILWTSGWDSTYRVAELLRQGRIIQPWYVLDSGRRSTKRELATMANMRSAFEQLHPAATWSLRPTKTFQRADIPLDAEITENFDHLAAMGHLGRQYDWLARLAKSQNVELELSIHKDDKAHGFLEAYAEKFADGYRLRDSAPSDLSIFKWFTFPIFDVTKLEMQEHAHAGGYAHIMEMSWFCFSPLLDGKPCGFCNPCIYTREEGLGRRVPSPTAARKSQYLALKALWKAVTLSRGRVGITPTIARGDEVVITSARFLRAHPDHRGLVLVVPHSRFGRYRVEVAEPGAGHAFPNAVSVKTRHLSKR